MGNRSRKVMLILIGVIIGFIVANILPSDLPFRLFKRTTQEAAPGYPFLAPEFNRPAAITKAEWEAAKLTAWWNNPAPLTDKLFQQRFVVGLLYDRLRVNVDVRCTKEWPVYQGSGKFDASEVEVKAAFEEAAQKILARLRFGFPKGKSGLDDEEVLIHFFCEGEDIGVWQKGAFSFSPPVIN